MFDGKTLEAALIDVPVTGRVSMRVQALAVRDCRPAKKLGHLTRLSSATEPCANEHVINHFAGAMRAPRGIGQRYLDRLDRVKKGSRPLFSPPECDGTPKTRIIAILIILE